MFSRPFQIQRSAHASELTQKAKPSATQVPPNAAPVDLRHDCVSVDVTRSPDLIRGSVEQIRSTQIDAPPEHSIDVETTEQAVLEASAQEIVLPAPVPKKAFTIADMQLAAYHSARAKLGKPVDASVAREARQVSDAINEVRSAIPYRGNCQPDHDETRGDAYSRFSATRVFIRPDGIFGTARHAAMALENRGGSCADYAVATHHTLGDTIQDGQAASYVARTNLDHAFALKHINVKDGPDYLTADAWAKGPPIHPDDSKFAAYPERFEYVKRFASAEARTAGAVMRIERMGLQQNEAYQERLKQFIRVYSRIDYNHPDVREERALWQHTNVIHDSFLEEAAKNIDHGAVPGSTELESQVRRAGHIVGLGGPIQAARKFANSNDTTQYHLQQIRRAGAVVALGGTTRDAAWFANRNRNAEMALLHHEFPDLQHLQPARDGALLLKDITTESGEQLDPWS